MNTDSLIKKIKEWEVLKRIHTHNVGTLEEDLCTKALKDLEGLREQKPDAKIKDLKKAFEAGQLDKGNNWYGGDFNQYLKTLEDAFMEGHWKAQDGKDAAEQWDIYRNNFEESKPEELLP